MPKSGAIYSINWTLESNSVSLDEEVLYHRDARVEPRLFLYKR